MAKQRKERSDKGKPRKSYKRKITGSSSGRTTDFESVNDSSSLSPVAKHAPEIVQSKSDVVKPETGDNVLIDKEITFEDLPRDRQDKVLHDIERRKILKLPDDSEERKQKAVNYYKFEMKRGK